MKLKRYSLVPWLLMIPDLFLVWLVRGYIAEWMEEKEFITLFGLLGVTVGVYWMLIIQGLWYGLICQNGRENAELRLIKERFRMNYRLSEYGLSYALWIDERDGIVAIWSRYEPFKLYKTEAGKITGVHVEEKGSEVLLRKLTLKLNADGNPIEIVLFHVPERMVLRTSEKAAKPLAQARAVCKSLEKAGAGLA